MTKLEPLGNRVLVQIIEQADRTASGIYLPETAKEKPQQAKVIAIGEEAKEDLPLQEGDVVLFPKYSGTEVKVDGTEYLILSGDDILARVIEEEGE